MHNALVVGGTSGLGLELSKILQEFFHVITVGRHETDSDFIYRDLSFGVPGAGELIELIGEPIELFIYAAGFYQEGNLRQLKEKDISDMLNVGLLAPISLLRRILRYQKSLPGFIVITSTSQFIPRLSEPVYTAVKAGLGMFANSVSLDPQIERTLVVAPAGMKTKFWQNTDKDTGDMLEPKWVADKILELYGELHGGDFKYKNARILRNPARVEIVEQR